MKTPASNLCPVHYTTQTTDLVRFVDVQTNKTSWAACLDKQIRDFAVSAKGMPWRSIPSWVQHARILGLGHTSESTTNSPVKQHLILKTINGVVKADHSNILESKLQRARKGNDNQFKLPGISSTIYEQSFSPRTLKLWNNLQQSLLDSTSHQIFKSNNIHNL